MDIFNHYSVLIAAALLLGLGLWRLRRPAGRRAGVVYLLVLGVLAVGWWRLRPVESVQSLAAGEPVLLVVQSPYCLGCVAVQPVLNELAVEMAVSRFDIQGSEGRQLARRLGVNTTPSFVLLDGNGRELWRGVGWLDAGRVRALARAKR